MRDTSEEFHVEGHENHIVATTLPPNSMLYKCMRAGYIICSFLLMFFPIRIYYTMRDAQLHLKLVKTFGSESDQICAEVDSTGVAQPYALAQSANGGSVVVVPEANLNEQDQMQASSIGAANATESSSYGITGMECSAGAVRITV